MTTRLVREFGTIVIEDLHVAGMLRNHHLARYIADTGWAEIRRQLTYKTDRAGARLFVAERWFASSKTCSGCGAAKTKLMLSERTYVCTACGIVLDRDVNAARNLATLAVAGAGELRREQPKGTDIRRVQRAVRAVGLPREEPQAQRHHRKVMAR
ncbi:MAG: RNA-guided endonuclease InsQ/TnpB family protein [Pseudonocardiaceae bacterium]